MSDLRRWGTVNPRPFGFWGRDELGVSDLSTLTNEELLERAHLLRERLEAFMEPAEGPESEAETGQRAMAAAARFPAAARIRKALWRTIRAHVVNNPCTWREVQGIGRDGN